LCMFGDRCAFPLTATFISIDPKKKRADGAYISNLRKNYHAITVADVADEPTADAAYNLAEITNLSSA